MFVYKRKRSLFWWVSVGSEQNRKRYPTPFLVKQHTKGQVQKYMAQKGVDDFLIALGITSNDKTLADVKVEYDREVDKKQGGNNSYAKSIKTFVSQFIEFIGKDRKPHTIRPKEIEDYLLHCLSEKKAYSTINKIKCYVNQFFDTAIAINSINKGENPADMVRSNLIPKSYKKKKKRDNKPIDNKYIISILSDITINYDQRLFWKIQVNTGFDPVDALNIKDNQIDRFKKTIHNKRAKNGEETNYIPISDDLLNADIVDLNSRLPQKTHKAKLRMSLKLLRASLKKHNYDRADVVTFKCLRHTFNQNLTLAGVDDTDRIQLMGQKSIKMQQTYTHADIENLRSKLVKAIPHVELLN